MKKMIIACVLGLCMAVMLAFAPLHLASGADGSVGRNEQQFREAAMAEVHAQEASSAGKFDEATELYAIALDNYSKLLKDAPSFRLKVVQDRTANCLNEIKALMENPVIQKKYAVTVRDLMTIAAARLEASSSRRSQPIASAASVLQSVAPATGLTTVAVSTPVVIKPAGSTGVTDTVRDDEMRKEMARIRNDYVNAVHELAKLKAIPKATKKKPGESGMILGIEAQMAELQRQIDQLRNEKTMLQSRVTELSARPRPSSPGGPAGLAIRLMKEDKILEAQEVLVNGLAKTPDDVDLKLALGILYCRQNKFAEAVRVLGPVVASDETDARACLVIGAAYTGLGKLNDAHFELAKAVGFEPDMPDAHYNLAQLLMLVKPADPKAAMGHYRQALQLGAAPDAGFEAELDKALNSGSGAR